MLKQKDWIEILVKKLGCTKKDAKEYYEEHKEEIEAESKKEQFISTANNLLHTFDTFISNIQNELELKKFKFISVGEKKLDANRGTVTCFPYNIVRHPAYICKNTFWIITTLTMFIVDFTKPGFDFGDYFSKLFLAVTSLIGWALIYYFRAVTEERHLIQDPEYREYTKKVKYRFIPGII